MYDQFLRTIEPVVAPSRMTHFQIYIISNNVQYTNEIIKLLHMSGIYNIIVNDMSITRVSPGSMLILCNIIIDDAIIYQIMGENNNAHMIYIQTYSYENSYKCNIICDMTTNIEKECKDINIYTNTSQPDCIVSMQCGYVVTNVIKHYYKTGTLGNFKWADDGIIDGIKYNIYGNDQENININIANGKPIFYTHINKMKGNVMLALPFVTEKKMNIMDNTHMYPICVVENFPTKIEHIVEWARNKYTLIKNNTVHDVFMMLFHNNIKALLECFPPDDTMWNNKKQPTVLEYYGDKYNEFVSMCGCNEHDFIVYITNLRAYCYKIDAATYETIIDIFNNVNPTIPSMIAFTNGLCEIEMLKYNTHAKPLNWIIDMKNNVITKQNIIPTKEININGVYYNEWHQFIYNNIDATLEDMIVDIDIMYGTCVNMIVYNNHIIYNDNMNISTNIDVDIKELFMEKFNIDIKHNSIIVQIVGINDVLLPLLIVPPK